MSINILHIPATEDQLKIITHDLAVMNVYLSMALPPYPAKESVIELFDHHVIANTGSQFVRNLVDNTWLIFFQIGKGSAALLIGISAVNSIDGLQDSFEQMLKLPTTIIETTRNYFSEVDLETPIGTHTSKIEISSSFLNIYIMPATTFVGSWTKQDGHNEKSN